MFLILYVLFGYIIGSLSPGYFFGRVVKNIDIRKFGNHNTGASNTYRVVGPVYGIIAAIFDILKAPLAYYLSFSKISPDLAIIVGLGAVFGHIFPFYLGFRGGRGVASLDGLFLISLIFSNPIYSLLLLIGMITYYLGFIKSVKISLRHWLKFLSIIFPLGLIWLASKQIILVLGFLLIISFTFDLLRWFSPTLNKRYLEKHSFSKDKEQFRFSGYSILLFSFFVVVALFPKEIAVVSLIFFVLGDIFAPFSAKIAYLPHMPLIGDKTLAGFIIVFAISFFAGWFLKSLTPLAISLEMIIFGAFLTAIFDQMAIRLDDNLLVPIGTATALWLLMV